MEHLYFNWQICKCLHSIDHHLIGPDGITFMCIVTNLTTGEQCECRFQVNKEEAYPKLKPFYKDMKI